MAYAVKSVVLFVEDFKHMVGDRAYEILRRAVVMSDRGIFVSGAVREIMGGDQNLISIFIGVAASDSRHIDAAMGEGLALPKDRVRGIYFDCDIFHPEAAKQFAPLFEKEGGVPAILEFFEYKANREGFEERLKVELVERGIDTPFEIVWGP